MSTDLFDSLVSQLQQRASEKSICSFDLDGLLAVAQSLDNERGGVLTQLQGNNAGLALQSASLLVLFDVVAVASALAMRALGTEPQVTGSGDHTSEIVGMWGQAQAARSLWGSHFLFAAVPSVEGRAQAIKETAKLLGAEAVAFSVRNGAVPVQFADFVAKIS